MVVANKSATETAHEALATSPPPLTTRSRSKESPTTSPTISAQSHASAGQKHPLIWDPPSVRRPKLSLHLQVPPQQRTPRRHRPQTPYPKPISIWAPLFIPPLLLAAVLFLIFGPVGLPHPPPGLPLPMNQLHATHSALIRALPETVPRAAAAQALQRSAEGLHSPAAEVCLAASRAVQEFNSYLLGAAAGVAHVGNYSVAEAKVEQGWWARALEGDAVRLAIGADWNAAKGEIVIVRETGMVALEVLAELEGVLEEEKEKLGAEWGWWWFLELPSWVDRREGVVGRVRRVKEVAGRQVRAVLREVEAVEDVLPWEKGNVTAELERMQRDVDRLRVLAAERSRKLSKANADGDGLVFDLADAIGGSGELGWNW